MASPSPSPPNDAGEGTNRILGILQAAKDNLEEPHQDASEGRRVARVSKGVSEATAALASSSGSSESSPEPDRPEGTTAAAVPEASVKGAEETTANGSRLPEEQASSLDIAQAEAAALVARLEEKLKRCQDDLKTVVSPPNSGRTVLLGGGRPESEGGAFRTGSAEYFDAQDEPVLRAESGDNEWHDAPEQIATQMPSDDEAPARQPPEPQSSDLFNPFMAFGFGGLGRSV